MNTAEIDAFLARVHRFTRAGLQSAEAESTADRLVRRDRECDDRRLCIECARLAWRGGAGWRCRVAQTAAVGSELPRAFVLQPQRCDGFSIAHLSPQASALVAPSGGVQ